MRFKHTILVLIDNFKVTYKLLVYLLIVVFIAIGLSVAIIVPFFNRLEGVEYYVDLLETFSIMFQDVIRGDLSKLTDYFAEISASFSALIAYVGEHPADFILSLLGLLLVGLICRFLTGLGNYTACALINDRMAMQANSPFAATMIKNLRKASLYSVIYAPISYVYDAACVVLLYMLLSAALGSSPLIAVFLFFVFLMLLTGVKMLFSTNWLPAIICGKQKVIAGMKYSFSLKGGNVSSVYSFFASSAVGILAFNVLAAMGTFGAALIITVPLSYLYLLCYELVNYCDGNEIKYFIDKRTIVKPEHEKATSRERFLKGE